MNLILKQLYANKKYNDIISLINNKQSPIEISGLSELVKVEFISDIFEKTNKPILLITYNEIKAQKLVEDISFFTSKVIFLPKKEIVTYDYIAKSQDLPYKRIDVLNKIYKNDPYIFVTCIETVKQQIPTKDILYKNVLDLKIGKTYNLEEIKQKLNNLGYERFDLIDGRGEFSLRGDILDIAINTYIEKWILKMDL